MDEDKKSRISTFRFGVIHDLVGHVQLETWRTGDDSLGKNATVNG